MNKRLLNLTRKRPPAGRGVFYHRDSGGEHENTPGQYVAWAARRSIELQVRFTGTADQIHQMIRNDGYADGDVFLDYIVKGNQLQRRGLDALIAEARRDSNLTHVFIPRADRLARPDEIMEGIKLEATLRQELGLTIVYMNRLLPAIPFGQKFDISELIVSAIEYDRAQKDRQDLAKKILLAQLTLAKMGFSTGGRPPYGFRRWLVDESGQRLRCLAEGEYVKRRGCHVVWLPAEDNTLQVRLRILDELRHTRATVLARRLSREGVPSPDRGRTRKDGGFRHAVSGLWHASTIVGIARHPLNAALMPYGRRSMGDCLRFSPEEPRPLNESDYYADGTVKVTANAAADAIVVPGRFEPLVPPAEHQKLLAILNDRAGTQRGKPRSRTPEHNPLGGGRIIDMNCTWPMYRQPYKETFRYVCALYQASDGARCSHNHVDGLQATRFLLGCVKQRLRPEHLPQLEARLRHLAEQHLQTQAHPPGLAELHGELASVSQNLETVKANMALAKTPAQRDATAEVFESLHGRGTKLQQQIAALDRGSKAPTNVATEIAAAMDQLRHLQDKAGNLDHLPDVARFFEFLNIRLFIRFGAVAWGKRMLRKPVAGVVTFGNAPLPVTPYQGPTARQKIKDPTAALADGSGAVDSQKSAKLLVPGREGDSLGNANRSNRTPVELFAIACNFSKAYPLTSISPER